MQIGIHSSTDEDLCHLISACRKLFTVLQPRNADVWKERFLVLWDYPDVTGREQFFIAYRLRKLVLRNFIDFRNGRDDRLPVQLEVLKDMVLGKLSGHPWHNGTGLSLRLQKRTALRPSLTRLLGAPRILQMAGFHAISLLSQTRETLCG